MEPEVFVIHERLKVFPPAQMLYITYRRLVEQGPRPTWLWLKDKLCRTLRGIGPASLAQVEQGLFVGGQQRRRGLSRMREMGISAIVNLREESDDAARGVTLDAYLWLPTTDDTPPTLDDLARGAAFIGEQIDAGRGVYIHCASGVGRAPTMATAYLVTRGLTPTQAWDKVLKVRPFVRPTPPQIKVIEAFAARRAAAQRRAEQAFERFLEDGTLTEGLTDELAKPLLAWAEKQVTGLATETAALDLNDDTATETLAPKLRQLREQVRQITRKVAGAHDPRAAMDHALALADVPQGRV